MEIMPNVVAKPISLVKIIRAIAPIRHTHAPAHLII